MQESAMINIAHTVRLIQFRWAGSPARRRQDLKASAVVLLEQREDPVVGGDLANRESDV